MELYETNSFSLYVVYNIEQLDPPLYTYETPNPGEVYEQRKHLYLEENLMLPVRDA